MKHIGIDSQTVGVGVEYVAVNTRYSSYWLQWRVSKRRDGTGQSRAIGA